MQYDLHALGEKCKATAAMMGAVAGELLATVEDCLAHESGEVQVRSEDEPPPREHDEVGGRSH